MSINFRKVAVIGTGFVGSSSAFALMQSGLFSEMVLVDVMKEKAEGEAMDINHGAALCNPMNIYAGDYADIKDAAIIVLTAGANQKPGETRLDLLKKNISIHSSIMAEIRKQNCEESGRCFNIICSKVFRHAGKSCFWIRDRFRYGSFAISDW